ncbi:MAG: amidohydrolase, partial [Candidatus Marinimicrobia bacterium]|nr:amidohydrolase [Candidatus Neomarinimicrobiota bacterium]
MKLGKLATFLMVIISFLPAQLEKVEHKPNPTKMVDFGDLAEGPYQKLVIRNVMVIPGHGGPANGPFDILVTGNVIAKIQRHDPKKPDKMKGDRIIEGDNLFVMPGMLNLHLHLRNESLPLDYIFYLQLATGVTSIGPAEEKRVQKILEAERNNEVISPRLFPLYGWGSKTDFDEEFIMDPTNADKVEKKMIKNGVRQVYINNLCWNPTIFGAAAKAIEKAGGLTAVHIQPSSTSQVNALDAARLGVSMIVHHYGYAESALNRGVMNYPVDYNMSNENIRFREAAQVWIEAGDNPETRHRLLNDIAD